MIKEVKKKDLDNLLIFKKKMTKAMLEFDSPISYNDIDWNLMKNKLLKDLEDKNSYTMFFIDEEKPVAFISYQIVKLPLLKKDKYLLHISNLYVDLEKRGYGIGEKLIKHTIKIAKEKKCIQIELNVFKDNPAINLYKKIGFNTLDLNMKYEIM